MSPVTMDHNVRIACHNCALASLPNIVSDRAFYYDLDEQEKQGGWGSATKAALGKMEYHIPAAACLTGLAAAGLAEPNFSHALPDNAVPFGISTSGLARHVQ